MQISVYTLFYSSFCFTCRSVVHRYRSILQSVLHVDQCFSHYKGVLTPLNQCWKNIRSIYISTPLYTTLYATCRSMYLRHSIFHFTCILVNLQRSILNSVLHVDQCIYTVLRFIMWYMQISVSTSFYYSRCVTCKDVYLHLTMLHSELHVCIYRSTL